MKYVYLWLIVTTLLGASSLKSAEIIPVWNKVNGEGMIEDMIHDIEFLRGENQLILLTGLGEKGDIQIRDTKTGELVSTYPINTLSKYNQIEITPDSNRCIITTGGNKTIGATIELRNLSDYSLLSKDTLILDGDKDPLGNPFIYLFRDMIVDPVRPLVYVMIEKTNFNVLDEFKDRFYLKVYNYETMELVKDLTPIGYEKENLKCFDVSDDGRYLAALNEGKAFITVWDLETYELIKNKQLYDNKLSNPNDYWCEAQDIEFSSIDNNLIYYSGKFPKINQSSYSGGIFEYYLSNNNIKKIEMDKDYTGGRFIFFENETRILNYNGELDFLNLLEQTIELNEVGTLEYPFGEKTILEKNDDLFIGYSYQYIGSLKYDSQSGIKNNYIDEIRVSPNPTSSYVEININCSEVTINFQIIDSLGNLLNANSTENQTGNLQFDFTPYPSGVYFLTINCNNQAKTYKVIKEN